MANTFKIKHGTEIPAAGDLQPYELGYSTKAGLYIGLEGGGVAAIAPSLSDIGIYATADEINKLQGMNATKEELNLLSGLTATTAELNVLDGITASTAELNYCDGVTSNIQTQLNGKANSTHEHGAGDITSGTLPLGRGGTGATTAAGVLTSLGITATATELNKLDGVTASTAELNILDGVTATTAELNYCDGVTSNIQTQLNNKLGATTKTGTHSSGTMKIGKVQICYGKCSITDSWSTLTFPTAFGDIPNVVITPHTTVSGAISGKTKNASKTSVQLVIGGNNSSTVEFSWIAIGPTA